MGKSALLRHARRALSRPAPHRRGSSTLSVAATANAAAAAAGGGNSSSCSSSAHTSSTSALTGSSSGRRHSRSRSALLTSAALSPPTSPRRSITGRRGSKIGSMRGLGASQHLAHPPVVQVSLQCGAYTASCVSELSVNCSCCCCVHIVEYCLQL
jgi:hypothetical protein